MNNLCYNTDVNRTKEVIDMTGKKSQYKYKFSSIETNILTNNTRQEFKEYSTGPWINTHPFEIELDTKEIDLHVYIDITDMSEFTDDSDERMVTLGVIPSFNSLTDSCQKNNTKSIYG